MQGMLQLSMLLILVLAMCTLIGHRNIVYAYTYVEGGQTIPTRAAVRNAPIENQIDVLHVAPHFNLSQRLLDGWLQVVPFLDRELTGGLFVQLNMLVIFRVGVWMLFPRKHTRFCSLTFRSHSFFPQRCCLGCFVPHF
ncbi:hypothetical protein BDN70DRAFT_583395 [Pholiota conissans]|uniref:Secreted protein n=1 Tax=Pholiota conissans TaxID=109636 RepID=A0A9P6CM32_9AGAR|nr:hypothetical protein BDN70DRAFT_583395 [Pholiota conissans]